MAENLSWVLWPDFYGYKVPVKLGTKVLTKVLTGFIYRLKSGRSARGCLGRSVDEPVICVPLCVEI